VEISSRAVDIDGAEHILAIVRDISRRKQAEQALRESQEQASFLADLVERSSQPMAVGYPDGSLGRFNEAFRQLTGYSAQELTRINWVRDLTPTPWREAEGLEMQELQRTGIPARYEKELLRQDGSVVPVEVLGHLIRDEAGQIKCYFAFITDISERKRAEQDKLKLEAQFRQAQKMEALGTLAGGVAHDFNNLLAVIMGFAEMSQEKLQDASTKAEGIEEIIQAASRAKTLVRRITSFSRAHKVESRPFDLNEEIEEAAKLLRRTLPRNIDIRLNLSSDLKPIMGDPNQMEQVLLNLATNAQHAMPQGGRLLIATSNIMLGPEFIRLHPGLAAGEYVRLEVSDTGTGMDAQTRERIFDPFFTTKEPGQGTGLGLSSVYGIVQGHGGYIGCYSEPGKGTTFKIYLAVYKDQETITLEEVPALAQELRGSETILLVDDEEALRKMGAQLLQRNGYRVVTAADGEEALAAYRAGGGDLDLVILDLGMPGMGGKQCLRQLLDLDPDVKVVIASGYAMEGSVKEALAAGAKGFVAKPFLRSDLLSTVRTVLDQDHEEPQPSP
jgi:PAS domain S-box-containing protein